MILQLPERENVFLRRLRELEILEDIRDHGLDPRGAVIVRCGDGHETEDQVREHLRVFNRARASLPPPPPTSMDHMILDPDDPMLPSDGKLCLQEVAVNGGSACLAHNWPTRHPELRKDLVVEQEIRDGLGVKKLRQIIAGIHFPCAMKRAAGATAAQMLNYGVDAKRRLQRTFRDEVDSVLVFVQIRWPDGKRNTYFLSRVRWESHVAFNPGILAPYSNPSDARLVASVD